MIEPQVSFIIPTYNRKEMLENTIQSIINLNYQNFQIVVVDDCSTCENLKMIQNKFNQYNVIYHRNSQNLYAAESRKVGFNMATGEYVVFIDDDDYYTDTEFINKALYIFEKYSKLAFVSFNADLFYSYSNLVEPHLLKIKGHIEGYDYLRDFQIRKEKPLSTFTTVFRRKYIEDKNLLLNDSSIYLYALTKGNAYLLDDVIGCYQIHENNITKKMNVNLIYESLDFKKYLADSIIDKSYINVKKWWRKQLFYTSKYYIRGSKLSYFQISEYFAELKKRKMLSNTLLFQIYFWITRWR